MKKNITAKTFTPIYDELEDRLRLVVNYQDIYNRVDFMITRNFILNLVPTAEEFMARHYGIVDFEATPQIETNDKVMSKTDNVNLELLRTNDDLLLEVNFSFDINSKHTILTLSSKSTTAKADLDGFMLSQIFQVIKSAIPYIRWGISYHF
ncbi:MAG: hypothetical protein PHQ93_04255 [Sulfurimonas sp.]|uniref:hypothetical protein n=1 Tax=Sulfurimonas sp. TaxID=2022749 RepID=UPI0026218D11|nr:hypothetical protein [Sulfurimonas sp.]MDD5400383.1 hypothetical protein [Sulfurimonas sp.]